MATGGSGDRGSMQPAGLAETLARVRWRLNRSILGGILHRGRSASAGEDASGVKGILRKGGDRYNHGRSVRWRPILTGDDAHDTREDDAAGNDALERERIAARERRIQLIRLPQLTYESLLIPVRITFPVFCIFSPAITALDVAVDVYELFLMSRAVMKDARAYRALDVRSPEALSAMDAEDLSAAREQGYPPPRLLRDAATILALHLGRVLYILLGEEMFLLWELAQVVRFLRVLELFAYMQELSSDLTTDAKGIATFKVTLVLFSVPHWLGCCWWLISEYNSDGESLALPSWSAQFARISGNESLEPNGATEWERYLLSAYMAWVGVTAMGYGDVSIVHVSELWFATFICLVQIVFYAYVLGTLFHYLVRTDENTVHFRELLKAVEDYSAKRQLPPGLTRKIRAHFEFQHRKQSSGTEATFKQLPHTLKLKVATAQYYRHVQSAWVFHSCNAQFLNQLVIVLRERFIMPLEVLFNQGDGSRELVWCIRGAVDVRKGDVSISRARSELGDGQVVGEIAFVLGIQHPYTVAATNEGDVTLLVLSTPDFDEVISSYPEQSDVIVQNVLRRFGLDKNGEDTSNVAIGDMEEDEREEFLALKEIIRSAIIDRKEDALSLITYAASEGDVETVRRLAAHGLDLDSGDYDKRTTLHLAAAEGNARVVALLVQLRADPNVKDRWGCTPIQDAILGQHDAAADELHKSGVQLELARPAEMVSDAAHRGDIAQLAKMLDHGILVNTADFDLRTPLHLAAAAGSTKVVEFLLTRLADVQARDRWGRSPIDDAVRAQHRIVTQLLVRHGSYPHPLLMSQRLCEAASVGDVDGVRFLVETGVSVDAGDYDSRTALHLAVCAGSISTAHYLITAMADVNRADRWGNPALVDALETHNECAALLINTCNAKLPPHVPESSDLHALHEAAKNQDMYLINRKLNARAERRKSILLAVQSRTVEMSVEAAHLMEELSRGAKAMRALTDTIGAVADDWLASYSIPEDSDDDSLLGGDDSGSSDEERGRAARGSPSPPRVHPDPQSPGEELTAKTFIRLVLRLPKAEAGLSALKLAFERRLDPSIHAFKSAEVRARDEHFSLIDVITIDCGIPGVQAQQAADEIYAELKRWLGAAAPSRPRPVRQPRDSDADSLADGEDGNRPSAGSSIEPAGSSPSFWPSAVIRTLRLSETERSSVERHSGRESKRGSLPGRLDGADENRGRQRHSWGRSSLQSLATMLQRPSSELSSAGAEDQAEKHGVVAKIMHRKSSTQVHPVQAAEVSPQRRAREEPEHAALGPGIFLSDIGYTALMCSESVLSILARNAAPADDEGKERFQPEAEEDAGEISKSPSSVNRVKMRLKRMSGLSPSPVARSRRASTSQRRPADRRAGPPGSPSGVGRESLDSSLRHSGGADASTHFLASPAQSIKRQSSRASSEEDVPHAANGVRDELTPAAKRQRDIGEAARVIESLFHVFDRKRKGVIQLRDVRSLQGSLGELGGREIKSLIVYLFEAADALKASTADEDGASAGDTDPAEAADASAHSGASEGKQRHLSRAQFNVGAAAWIMASAVEAGEGDDADAASSPTSPGPVPMLSLATLSRVSRQARTSRASAESLEEMLASVATPPHADDEAGAQAPHQHHKAHDTAKTPDNVAKALDNPPALTALADHVQVRIDSGRLRKDDEVEAVLLVTMIFQVISLDINSIRASDVESWARNALNLEISSTGVARPRARRRLSNVGDRASHSGEPTGTLSRRSSTGTESVMGRSETASAPPAADDAFRASLTSAVAQAATERDGEMRASWKELVTALNAYARRLADKAPAHAGAYAGPLRRVLLALGIAGARSYADAEVQGADGGRVLAAGQGPRPWFVLRHEGRANLAVKRLFLLCTTWDFLAAPVYLGFFEQVQEMNWVFIQTAVLTAIYVVRIVIRFCTDFVNAKSAIVIDPVQIRTHYLSTDFTLDVLAAWPHDLLALASGAPAISVTALYLIRLINLRHLRRAYRSWVKRQAEDDLVSGLVHYLSILLVTAHVCACIFNAMGFEPAMSNGASHTWVDQYRADVNGATEDGFSYPMGSVPMEVLMRRYTVSIFYIMSMLTTLGLGQVPSNYSEIGFFIFIMVLNMTVYAWTVGQISALVMKQDDEIVAKRSQLELVESYVAHIRVPPELKEQIQAFFHTRLKDASLTHIRDEQIYDAMPISLQVEVSRYTNRALVSECMIVRGCSEAFLDRLSSLLRERALDPETQVFRVGDASKELVLVESGAVEVYPDAAEGEELDEADFELASSGDTIGDLAFVFGIRHFQNARTTPDADAHVFTLSTESYRVLVKMFPTQEDKVMNNAMLKYDGMLTSRSSKSKGTSRRSSSAGAPSVGGDSAAPTEATDKTTITPNVDVKLVQKVISDVRKKRKDNSIVRLCSACFKGDLELVQRLLTTSHVDVNMGDYDQRRPIHLAACEGHVKIIELLFSSSADVNVKDRFDGTPLTDALRHGQLEAAALIRRLGGKRHAVKPAQALCFAAADAHGLPLLKQLLMYDMNPSESTVTGRTALHVAAANGLADHAKELIDAKADVNAEDISSLTPLQEALTGGHEACSRLLLASGATLGSFDSAFHMCTAASVDDVDQLRRLIEHRCDVNCADYDKRTPLMLAASNARVNACTFLLEQDDIAVNQEDRYGNTAYDDAMRESHPDQPIVKTLLETRGGKEGSHIPFVETKTVHVEEERLDKDSKEIEMKGKILDGIRQETEWIRDERAAAGDIKHLIEKARKLEADLGPVLLDQKPAWLHKVREFANKHRNRVLHVERTLTQALESWNENVDFAQRHRMQKKLEAFTSAISSGSVHMNRLAEANFKRLTLQASGETRA